MKQLLINPKQEVEKITRFLKETCTKNHIENVVIGLSGGIDSTTSFYLLTKVIDPNHIFVAHLSYFPHQFPLFASITAQAGIPQKNIYALSIKEPVNATQHILTITDNDTMRLGNIMARMRMIYLYDLAKRHNALVCGTENKSEHYLGYFTRFGDEASDIEPIRHLYKTQVYQLATYLKIPEEIIQAKPTAGLWEGQTDESEFGFTYQEADAVLYYFFEEKLSLNEIVTKGYVNAEKIINRALANEYKHQTPYTITY